MKSRPIHRTIAFCLLIALTLTGCMEDPFYQPAHTVGKLLGADSSNIILDFPIGTWGGSAPYCLFFTTDQKLNRADIDRVAQSLSYTVTVQEFSGSSLVGHSSNCDVRQIEKYAHRSEVKFSTFSLVQGDHLATSDTPRSVWHIDGWRLTETSSIKISIEQIEYTPTTANIQLNGKPMTKTLVIVVAG